MLFRFYPSEWSRIDMNNLNNFDSSASIDFEKMQEDLKRYFRRENFYKKNK